MLTLDQMSDAVQFAKLIGRLLDSAGETYTAYIDSEDDQCQIVIDDIHNHGYSIVVRPRGSYSQFYAGRKPVSDRMDMDSYGLLQIKELIQEWK